MGAWGYKTYENDIALDYTIEVLEESYSSICYVEQALVWLDMVKMFRETIAEYQYQAIHELICEELDNLDNWAKECQEDREKMLHQYLDFMKTVVRNKGGIGYGNYNY